LTAATGTSTLVVGLDAAAALAAVAPTTIGETNATSVAPIPAAAMTFRFNVFTNTSLGEGRHVKPDRT
jgi:hypothetical protein